MITEYCSCCNSPSLNHIGWWQHASLKIDANYQCVYCGKYYKEIRGKLKEIVNFRGVTKNVIVPREWREKHGHKSSLRQN
jgi:hypothetical protein